ncbi:MAG: hypothetical protein IJ716_09375 [Lachnospiraceae bacterium]|nr:hypothetical protein [Lachnospiraceae bacterium]
MGKNNFPTSELSEVPAVQIKEMVTCLLDLRNKGKPKDNIELQQRIDDYFAFCRERGWRPGVEGLACALSVSRQTVFYWLRGENCDAERAAIMQNAKQSIDAFLEQMALAGKLNPATSIFLMKNWMNYRDSVSIEQGLPLEHNGRSPLPVSALPQLGNIEESEE